MFHYDATHCGSPDNEAPVTYDLLWTFNTILNNSYGSILSSSPAVINGAVYIGGDDGNFYAINATTGNCLWRHKLGDFQVNSPAVVGGMVYVSVWDGKDYALNAATGQTIWSYSHMYSYSSPAVSNGIYYACSSGVYGGCLNALNASTGSLIWSTAVGSGDATPVIVGDTLYLSDSGSAYALDSSNGALKWNSTLRAGATYNSPTVANGIVYVGCEGNDFYALNASSGLSIWNCTLSPSDGSTPAVIGGVVYVGCSSNGVTSGVYALNASTGAKIWNYQTSIWDSSLSVAGGVVYACNSEGVHALNANTGTLIWIYNLGNTNINSAPAVAGGVLFVKSGNGYLYAFGKSSQPTISLQPNFGFSGTSVTISGSGFASGSSVTITFGGAPISLNNSAVDSLGHIAGAFTIPSSTPGHYQINVADTSGNAAFASYLIVAPTTVSWPMYMHDLQHSGSPDNTSAIDNSLLWKFSVDRANNIIRVASSAAVIGGIVYDASQNCYVYALDAYTGACYWKFSLGGISTLSSPVIVDGVVYIGGDHGVYAINAYSGTKIWNNASPRVVFSAPAVSNGVVYAGSFIDGIFAFRASDGVQLWRYPTIGEVDTSPAVSGNTVYAGSEDGDIYALNTANGALVWKYNCSGTNPYSGISASPAVVNGVVYTASEDGNIFALNAATGSKLWNHTTVSASSPSAPSVANGIVYIESNNGTYSFNANTGEEIWHIANATGHYVPAVAGGVVYAACDDDHGDLYALNAATGAKLWNYSIGDYFRSSPSIAKGVIYVGTEDGTIYAIGTPQTIPDPTPTPSPTQTPTQSPTTPAPTQSPTQSPSTNIQPTATPSPSAVSTSQPTQTPTSSSSATPAIPEFPILTIPLLISIMTTAGLLAYIKKRKCRNNVSRLH
jgi:outer membrane protein assembly factor BamB